MTNEKIKDLLYFFIIIFLTVSAFFIRHHNFINTKKWTIDEFVYYKMALQVSEDISDYNTIPYGEYLASQGRPLPDYFFQPLFKHPPVFTYLAALSLKLFGDNFFNAGYIPLLSGVLTIPLVFLLGALVFNRVVGVIAAVLLWMDPVSIICSQKVWMDSTIAFFSVFAIVMLIQALKTRQSGFFIAFGVLTSLAVNTKYTGIIIVLVPILYALFYQRTLFTKRIFIFSIIMPFISLIPWGFWNMTVYGVGFLNKQIMLHSDIYGLYKSIKSSTMFFVFGCIILFVLIFIHRIKLKSRIKISKEDELDVVDEKGVPFSFVTLSFVLYGLVFFLLFFLLQEAFIKSLNWLSVPKTSWRQGIFIGAPRFFYFAQLLEFSLFYSFAYIALFSRFKSDSKYTSVLRISSLLVLIFFILWGNYQSRYILTSIPFLLVLSAYCVYSIFVYIRSIDLFLIRAVLQAVMTVIVVYGMSKIYYLNAILSFTNDVCYF